MSPDFLSLYEKKNIRPKKKNIRKKIVWYKCLNVHKLLEIYSKMMILTVWNELCFQIGLISYIEE